MMSRVLTSNCQLRMSRPGSTLVQDLQQGGEHLYDSIAPPTHGEVRLLPGAALMSPTPAGWDVSCVSQYSQQVRKWSPHYVSPPPTSSHYISAPATVTASPVSQVTHRVFLLIMKRRHSTQKFSSLKLVNITGDDI